MASNVTVEIEGDASQLKAQTLVAEAALASLQSQARRLAREVARTGDEMKNARLGQLAAQLEPAIAKVADLKGAVAGLGASLETNITRGFAGMGAAIRDPLDALAMMSSRLRQTAEVAAITYAADKLIEWTHQATESAERATNLAAAVGLSPAEFVKLSSALAIAGGDGEAAARTMERLARNVGTALGNPASTSAKAFLALGISQDELKTHSGDLNGVLGLLAEAFVRFQDSPTKIAAFMEILGRGMISLIQALRGGSAGLKDLTDKAKAVSGELSGSTIGALADSAEKMHTLGVAAKALGSNLVASLKPMIDAVTSSLTSMIAALNQALGLAATDSASRLGVLTAQLDAINQQIAAGGTYTHLPRQGTVFHPMEEGEVHRFTHGPRFGQLDTSYNNLATLRARALAIQAQIDQVQEDMRERASAQTPGKPVVPPLETGGRKAGGAKGGGDTTSKDYQKFAEGERLKIAEAEAANQSIMGILQQWLAEAARVYTQDSIEYKRVQLQIVEAKKTALAELARLEKTHFDEQIKEQRAAAAEAAKTAKEWAAPFKKAFDGIAGDFEKAFTDMLLHKGTSAEIRKTLSQSLVGQGVSLVGSTLSKGAAGLLDAKGGQGLGDFLGDKLLGFLGLGGGQAPQITLLSTLVALQNAANGFLATLVGTSAAGAGTSAAGSIAGGGISAAGSIAGGGGGFFGFLGRIGSFLGFARGGIVPSAAGGWALPSFPGMQPAMLHSREMVLPAHIADAVLAGANRQGGGTGGGTHVHPTVVINGPADAAQVARFFRDNHGHVSEALRTAFRSNSLTPRTF